MRLKAYIPRGLWTPEFDISLILGSNRFFRKKCWKFGGVSYNVTESIDLQFAWSSILLEGTKVFMPRTTLGVRSSKRAFTLIELLVVIAIIAILAAILFPVFAQAKESAKKAVDLSNQKQTLLAAVMYSTDSDDYFVMLRNGFPQWGCNGAAEVTCYQVNTADVALQPYMKSWPIWSSPNDSIFRNDCPSSGTNNPGAAISYSFTGHADPAYIANNPYYTYTRGVSGWMSGSSPGNQVGSSLSSTAVGSPGDTIVMYPYYATFSYERGLMAWSANPNRIALPDAAAAIPLWPQYASGYFWCTPNDEIAIGAYLGKTNFGFADGHVKTMDRTQTMDDLWATNEALAFTSHAKNMFDYDSSYHQN